MPFGKKSQQPVPKQFMVKKHAGMGTHKQVLHSHAAVRSNGPLPQATSGNRSSKAGQ